MAFLVARRDGRFEIRESVATPRRPRARTLASFRTLTAAVLERAEARACATFDAERIRARAAELGVPQHLHAAGATARLLVAELRAGQRLPPALAKSLRQALPRVRGGVPDALAGALEWIGVDDEARGRALYDLLDLASRVPTRRRDAKLAFPRFSSVSAK